MIHFRLKDIDDVLPAGRENDQKVSWFYLTDGEYWLTFGNQTIYEHTDEVIAYWEEEATRYCDYYIVRFLEDFSAIFEKLRESVPIKFYELTDNLIQFRMDGVKWINTNLKEDDDDFNDDFWKKHDKLTSWLFERSLFASHLVGGPAIAFVRHNEKIKIHFETDSILENGLKKWTATNGSYVMDYSDFVDKVKDFGDRFFDAMDKQVELAIAKDWKDIKIDKKRLVEEHAERKEEFYVNYTLLTKTHWMEIEELYRQMKNEIS